MAELTPREPIFLLGSGRCGSTNLQRLLCSRKGVWIWGEHDGMLVHLANMLRLVEPGSALSRWHFDAPDADKAVLAAADWGGGDATRLAWMNGFDREALFAAIKGLVYQMFTRSLPPGKYRWGFKEIRYGPDSRVPELLLEMFPGATIIITARQARPTVVSSVASWHFESAKSIERSGRTDAFETVVQSTVERWIKYYAYFADLRDRFPRRVTVSRLEAPEDVAEILRFARIDDIEGISGLREETVNAGSRTSSMLENAAAINALDSVLSSHHPALTDIERRLGYAL